MLRLRNLGKILSSMAGILLVLFLALFTWVDRTPYVEKAYYHNTIERLDNLKPERTDSGEDTLRVGWARVNITPGSTMPLAGYGKRRGKKYVSVNDSIWVRAFVFDDGRIKSTLVTADLLILPPEVDQNLRESLDKMGFQNSFFTATHSHSSIGGWASGLTGHLFAGEYDPKLVETLQMQIIKAVRLADEHKAKASIGYAAFKTDGLVYNRLVKGRGEIDPWLRIVRMQQIDGSTALLASFSAHATCLSAKFLGLSGDYPGLLVQAIEDLPRVDFAAFAAGAMASQGPIMNGENELESAGAIARDLANQISLGMNFVPTGFTSELASAQLAVDLRDPHFRISKNIRIRPWLFDLLVGHHPVYVNALKIGDILLLGTPCDFSGELVDGLEQKARKKGLNLIITSFNGGYMGYVTKDLWYDEDLYETRTMNWYGPYNGAYFTELMSRLLDKF